LYRSCQQAVFAVGNDTPGIVAEASAICLDGWGAGVDRVGGLAAPQRMSWAARVYALTTPRAAGVAVAAVDRGSRVLALLSG
jgi:hypothetical protein